MSFFACSLLLDLFELDAGRQARGERTGRKGGEERGGSGTRGDEGGGAGTIFFPRTSSGEMAVLRQESLVLVLDRVGNDSGCLA